MIWPGRKTGAKGDAGRMAQGQVEQDQADAGSFLAGQHQAGHRRRQGRAVDHGVYAQGIEDEGGQDGNAGGICRLRRIAWRSSARLQRRPMPAAAVGSRRKGFPRAWAVGGDLGALGKRPGPPPPGLPGRPGRRVDPRNRRDVCAGWPRPRRPDRAAPGGRRPGQAARARAEAERGDAEIHFGSHPPG